MKPAVSSLKAGSISGITLGVGGAEVRPGKPVLKPEGTFGKVDESFSVKKPLTEAPFPCHLMAETKAFYFVGA